MPLQRMSGRCKTERECVKLTRRLAEEQGYQNLKTFIENGTSLKAGDKVYAERMEGNNCLIPDR